MSTDPEGNALGTKRVARFKVPAVEFKTVIGEPTVSRILEAVQEIVESSLDRRIAGLVAQLEKMASVQREKVETAPAPSPRGIKLSDDVKQEAFDLRASILLGKVPEKAGLLIDTRVTAKLLNVSPRTLFRLKSEQAVPEPVRIAGKMLRWRLPELLAWIEAGCPPQKYWSYRPNSKEKHKR